ncbi:MAG: TonB-dependent receptor plug domain-containing protein, partial [Polyangiaceae bacterium]|nr:TonB-dependent receptor plug domain-containing protein [Polyangiaceae bacterium]
MSETIEVAPDDASGGDSEPSVVLDDEPETEEEIEPIYSAHAEVDATRLRAEDRGASDVRISRDVLSIAPHADAGELLRTAPGVFVARSEGDAVAQRIMLRGFDAEHGQDLELTLDGIPINQPSHLHGQGYADLGFLIPEVVRSIRITEGVYDPRQGDFAVAGTADFELGVEERGLRFQTSTGSFRTFRQVAIWAPRGEDSDTFGAASFRRTDGFGAHRAGRSGSVLVQQGFGEAARRWRVLGSFHAARADMAGVVRADDVASGDVGFYDVYDDPSARAQNAASVRAQVAARGERRGANGQNGEIAIWALFQDFRLQENLTGYTRRSTTNPTWVGRGDLIEQRNRNTAVGIRARHRSEELRPLEWLHGHLELGIASRADLIEQQQNLLEVPENQTWDELIDASIVAFDVGAYADADIHLTERFRVRGGARADLLAYEV